MLGRYTSEQLKKIAMGTMLLDHAAVALIYNRGLDAASPLLGMIGLAMRLVGRMAFPLYAFLLVQGFLYTKSWKRYLMRVVMFAAISEIPFNLAAGGQIWYLNTQNTMLTMSIGLLCMKGITYAEQRFPLIAAEKTEDVSCIQKAERLFCLLFRMLILGGILFIGMLLAELLRADYGAYGILLIMIFYLFRYQDTMRMAVGCILMAFMYNFSLYTLFAWIAFFFINRYNGERGRKLGLLPYIFYPAHLLAVYLAAQIFVPF